MYASSLQAAPHGDAHPAWQGWPPLPITRRVEQSIDTSIKRQDTRAYTGVQVATIGPKSYKPELVLGRESITPSFHTHKIVTRSWDHGWLGPTGRVHESLHTEGVGIEAHISVVSHVKVKMNCTGARPEGL